MPGGQSCCTNWHFKLKEQKWQLCVCWFSQSSVVTFSQCFSVGLTRQWMETAQWVRLLPCCTVGLVVALLHSEFGCCLIAQWVWLLPCCTVSLVVAQWVWLLCYCTVSLVVALLQSVTVTGRRQRVCTMPQWTHWVSASTWRESTRGAACVWTAR